MCLKMLSTHLEIQVQSPIKPYSLVADLAGKNMKLNMDIHNMYQNVVLWPYHMYDMQNVMQALIAAEIINQM